MFQLIVLIVQNSFLLFVRMEINCRYSILIIIENLHLKLFFMKNNTLILFMSIFTISFFLSCGASDPLEDRCGANWAPATELQDEIEALTNAATVYGQNPTIENCEAYKAAYQDYLDEIKDWEDCYVYVGQQAEFNQAIADAQADLDAFECD